MSLRTWTFGMIGLGLLLAGCQGGFSRQQAGPPAAQTPQVICAGYGIRVDGAAFDRCVAYQEAQSPGPSVPPYRLDQYNNRVDAQGYQVDSTGRRMPVQSPYNLPTGASSSSGAVAPDGSR